MEKREGLHRAPQAHVISSRTMEILRAAGIDQEVVRAIAAPMADIGSVQWVHTLAGPEIGRIQLATPERIGKMLSSTPTPFANISQSRLEPLLLEYARDAGAAVDFGCEWRSFESAEGGVRSTLCNMATGVEEQVRSRFLLGCDGAASRVRRALGIEMVGPERVETVMNICLEVNLRSLLTDRAEPAESLTASIVWSSGLPDADIDLDGRSIAAMLEGRRSEPSTLITGRPATRALSRSSGVEARRVDEVRNDFDIAAITELFARRHQQ